jgi:hypothetical protein
MSKKIPTNNTLHPAFYKMMDYLLDPQPNLTLLNKRGLTGFTHAPNEILDREGIDMQNYLGKEYFIDNPSDPIIRFSKKFMMEQRSNPEFLDNLRLKFPNYFQFSDYQNDICRTEYQLWLDSLKFQFYMQTLHEYLPKGISFQKFFSDIHLRIPHEKTLLIQLAGANRISLVSVVEERFDMFNNRINKLKKEQDENFTDRFKRSDLQKLIKSWGLNHDDTVYKARLSVYSNFTHDDIANKHEHDPLDILAIARPNCYTVPTQFIFPAGKTLEETRGYQPLNIFDRSTLAFAEDNNCFFNAHMLPIKSYGIRGKPIQMAGELGTDPILRKQTLKEPKLNTALCVYELIFSAISHMSVYSHPDFKEFCVRELKQQGLEPKKVTYHTGKPFKKMSNKPKFEHYLLDLNIPTECDDHTTGKAGKKRFHLVRGHLMRTQDKGFTWRRSHWRGNRELGVITKDYNIKIDPRIKRNKPDRHETTTVSAERT